MDNWDIGILLCRKRKQEVEYTENMLYNIFSRFCNAICKD